MLVGVILPGSTADPRDPLGELGSLAKTAGAQVVGEVLQKRHRPGLGHLRRQRQGDRDRRSSR